MTPWHVPLPHRFSRPPSIRHSPIFPMPTRGRASPSTSNHADLLDHLHTLPPPGYSAVSVQQILRADRAAFMFLSESMTFLKRNAMNQLPLDLQLPTSLSQPNVAFRLLPLSGGTPKAPSAAKASNPKKRSRSPRKQQPVKGKGGRKARPGKNRGPNIPAGLINKALRRRLRSNASIGHTICQMVVAKPKQEKGAPRAIIYAQSRGVSNPTRFKTIVEAIKVSPMAGLFQDSISAKFLH